MALNLSRNSKLFFTSNVDQTTGVVPLTGFTNANTFEIQVLDGFSFSQNTNTETVTLSEAGSAPVRGQRTFNTSLAPVDFSFSTYVRPEVSTNVVAEESVLWGALLNNPVGTLRGFTTAGAANVGSTMTLAGSNVNQLYKAGLIMIIDNVTYVIDNVAMNQAVVDFAIDQIATIQWSGFGSALRQLATNVVASSGTFSAGITTGYFVKDTDADFITNKLSTATLQGTTPTVSSRTIAITGGSLTYNNNITFLTPTNLAVVNTPITYFTGTRSITGSLTAYLKTGDSTDVGNLLNTMLTNITNTETNFAVTVDIGGTTSSTPRLKLSMPTCSLQIPTVDVQQVVSTSINFTAQGFTSSAFDVAATNELVITYFAPA